MKKVILILIAISILTSCKKSFLELYPTTNLNEANFYQTQDQYILLANGCYAALRDAAKYNWWALAEMPSDNVTFQYNPLESGGFRSTGTPDFFQETSGDPVPQNFWNQSYQGITNCNKLLNEMGRPSVTWTTASIKDRCYGEAFFLRALYYFNLVRAYGGVPLVTTPITSVAAVGIKRSTEEVVYDTIVSDLNRSITHFAVAMDVEEKGRANWAAASALLGKVYLTIHKYPEAGVPLKSVIDLNKYSLLPVYSDVFNPAKKDYTETLFAIQYSEANATLANNFIFWFCPVNSKGDVTHRPSIALVSGGFETPTDALINAFEPGDTRKNVSIAYWTGPDWDGINRPLPYCNKFKPPISAPDNRCGDNFPIIRYSDVLLMYAEVLNDEGSTDQAIPYVQQVRNRAGLTSPLTGYVQATLDTLIAHERQVEFCFENQRYYDLKRTGKAIEVLKAHGIYERAHKAWIDSYYPGAYNVTENKLLVPIPVNEINVNKLEQNPGY
jgi:starch-binding outer membrane protein, SusD/RagB family